MTMTNEGTGNCAASGVSPEQDACTINPYAGGGGGTVLAHRIATSYFADLLLGAGRPETDELPVVSVAFQTNPIDPVDDLRVEAERDGDRVVVHVAARRTPNFTKSHKKTAELVGTLLDQIDTFGDNDRAYVAVALVGMANPHREVQRLASLARDNKSEPAFHAQVHEKRRHKGLAKRYEHLTGLVSKARPNVAKGNLRELVRSLLSRLWILDFRVESDDETDWVQIGNRLDQLARNGKTGVDVRDRLHSACATQFDQMGTVVDRSLVRRKIHSVLSSEAGRSKAAWEQLDLEQSSAMVAVRHELAGAVELPRTRLRTTVQSELNVAGIAQGAVLVTGESGTGKSALTLSAATTLAAVNDNFQFVVLNLRRTRNSAAALAYDLGMTLTDALREMSAPSRVLILDAADAALEGRGPLLRELATAAHEADVGLALISADAAVADTAGTLVGVYSTPRKIEVPGLNDMELRVVGAQVPTIAGALRNLPTKSLYRRFAVVDLLARTGTTVTTALDEWGCLELIWRDLIGRAADGSSGTARTEALLAMSESELGLPETEGTYPRPDPAALDALRVDLLVAPENLLKTHPEFAHDEVRRFATAVRLARDESVTGVLKASGPARWAMSAAKLACQGKLSGAADPNAELAALMTQFDVLGDESTARWKQVPLEAVLEIPSAYNLLRHMLEADASRSNDALATLVRVVSVHQRHNNMVDVPRGEPVVRLVMEEVDEPWHQDDEMFRLLREWLDSALMEGLPAGNSTRAGLRKRMLDHWRTYHPSTAPTGSYEEPDEEVVFNIFGDSTKTRRRQRTLNWQITQERYLELFALLGPDINDDVRACLSEVAADSPSRLQSVVDLDWSSWGLGLHDPKFLLELTEAYYIDNRGGGGWRHWKGIRDHRPRYRGLNNHTYGSFWVLTRLCPHEDWIPAMNRMLNHAATIRCHAGDITGSVDPASTFSLVIDGTERKYVGDTSVWGWYRGNTNGPYPCMSALQAVERWFDRMVAEGTEIEDVATALLNGCENLAMPALIVGALIRHIGANPKALDQYIVEPLIWQFDSIRVTHEAVGFMRASDDGITKPECRKWYLRDIVGLLILSADPERRAELKDLGDQLIANTARFDAGESAVRGWAATFDAANMTTEPTDGGVLVSIAQPEDLEKELAPMRADMARGELLLGIQNKYWIPERRREDDWQPPTPVEIAKDLALVKDLFENPPEFAASDPYLALAHVAAAAVRGAAAGDPEAFGEHATFAIKSTLGIIGHFAESATDGTEPLWVENDIGTRAAAAAAIPDLLLPELAEQLADAGATADDVNAAAATLGRLAATETCLKFARGCDPVWAHPCVGDPCIHFTAYEWTLDLARGCEIGEFDVALQHSPRVFIGGDVTARIPEIRPGRLDTTRLSAAIRALGHASSSNACLADTAERDLRVFLQSQARAMATQETSEEGYFIDDHGAETMTAARALLHNRSRADTTDDLLLQYTTLLAPASHVFSAFLRDLAAAGTETQELADAANAVWHTLFAHVLDQVDMLKDVYEQSDSFNDYTLSHLLPNLECTPESLHSEMGRDTFQWMNAEKLVELVPRWLPHAAGRSSCLLELVHFLRQLPIEVQLSDGLAWLNELCLSSPHRQLPTYAPMDEWLVEIKLEADARGRGADWLHLVDRLVYAGNRTLATYSR